MVVLVIILFWSRFCSTCVNSHEKVGFTAFCNFESVSPKPQILAGWLVGKEPWILRKLVVSSKMQMRNQVG